MVEVLFIHQIPDRYTPSLSGTPSYVLLLRALEDGSSISPSSLLQMIFEISTVDGSPRIGSCLCYFRCFIYPLPRQIRLYAPALSFTNFSH